MEPRSLGPQHAGLQATQASLLEQSRGLWREAPSFRLLVASTLALFVASAATAILGQLNETPAPGIVAATAERSPDQPPLPSQVAATPASLPRSPTPQPAPPAATASPDVAPNRPQPTPATASPRAAPPPDTACNFRGGSGSGGQGRVVGFLSREQAARMLAFTQQKTGASINPDYVGNARVVITVPTGNRVVVLQPPGLLVKPGDRVAFASGHRDWSMACGYIPNLIIGLLQSP